MDGLQHSLVSEDAGDNCGESTSTVYLNASNKMKISIVGVGNVGSIVALFLARRGLAEEIVLCARDTVASQRRANAEALDINHAIAFTGHNLIVRAGTTKDTADSSIVVFAASVPSPSGMTDRMQLARGNAKLTQELIPSLVHLSPEAIFINVSNPLDVVTYEIIRLTGLGYRKVFGTGTLIDSARFRRCLANELDINALDINAYVIGEHGNSQFATLSHATTGGMKLDHVMTKLVHENWLADAEADARTAGFEIFNARGYTNYAVAMAVEMIVDGIVHDRCETLPVSVLIDGFCGVRAVCLSVPCVIGHGGIKRRLAPELDEAEKAKFQASAKSVRSVIDDLQIDEMH